jgi:hypothetical protein
MILASARCSPARTAPVSDRPVMAKMDHLGAPGLHDPPHDVDRRVVPVEQRRRCHEPHRMRRHVRLAVF